ncbi:MAG: glucosaminidase domain-containing protein [Bacteroidaceae bacterium]|nr:glucosaminidase domain-containing protein [Bacteroidaceae bacterium]
MKSRLFSTFSLLLFLQLCIFAQRTNQAYWAYIDQYKGIAIEQMHKYRIPASITLAQGLLESGAGRSSLATKAHNHFGIKVSGNWTGPYVLKNDDAPNEKFRKYNNARESYEDHSRFLQGRRYQGLFQLKITDYRGWARGLKAAGYATSPTYAESLIRIIEMYNLYQFDNGSYRQERKSTAPVIPTINAQSSFFQTHTLYKHNKNYFIIVEIGDNMATISKETGISLKKLYQYNDLPLDYAPTQGDLIYLKKKQKCASKQFKKNPIHIVEPNQSMFDISQLYGIRLKSLYKLNKFEPSHEIKPGDILRIR